MRATKRRKRHQRQVLAVDRLPHARRRPYFGAHTFRATSAMAGPESGRYCWHGSGVAGRRDEALETAASVMAAIEHNENSPARLKLSLALVEKIAASIVARFDPRNGGFVRSPSFRIRPRSICCWRCHEPRPRPSARPLSPLCRRWRARRIRQLAGGFHRYS